MNKSVKKIDLKDLGRASLALMALASSGLITACGGGDSGGSPVVVVAPSPSTGSTYPSTSPSTGGTSPSTGGSTYPSTGGSTPPSSGGSNTNQPPSSNGGGVVVIDPGYNSWYDVYGFRCGSGMPGPGCNYYSDGLKVIDIEDPFFDNSYFLKYGTYTYYDTYGFLSSYSGWAWQSADGVLYDDFGNALNQTGGKSRDIVGDVARSEKSIIKTAGEQFAAKYNLSAETGIKVARVLNDWAKLGKSRARTAADISDFSKKLYGVDINKIQGAVLEAVKGNKAQLNSVISETATNWATTPETMKEILKSWYGNQVGAVL